MKKVLVFCLAAAMAVTASITAFAENGEKHAHECDGVELTMQGRGACTQPNCKCPAFKQRPGYNQCWCGHQSFSHK